LEAYTLSIAHPLGAFHLDHFGDRTKWQGKRTALDSSILHDDHSSLGEEQFIGFFHGGAEYYPQPNGWNSNPQLKDRVCIKPIKE
jgi:hypothetical protein